MAQATADGLVGVALLERMAAVGLDTLAWLSFWFAIILPAAYLPLLVLGRVDAAAGFIAVHVVSVVMGQRHG